MDLARAVQPLAYLLAPVLIYQGLGLRRRIPRLPEATDPAGSVTGDNPPVRLAVLGDSTAAGVGAGTHQEALAGQLATAMAAQTGRAVSWRAVARSGATSLTARELVPRLVDADWQPDLVVVCVGVNDLKNLRLLRAWDRDVAALLAAIQDTAPEAVVIVSGMAPVSRFPALPQPMRAVMALRAIAMDHALQRLAGRGHVAVDAGMIGDGFFATDGFHPSSSGYRAWAEALAASAAAAVAP